MMKSTLAMIRWAVWEGLDQKAPRKAWTFREKQSKPAVLVVWMSGASKLRVLPKEGAVRHQDGCFWV